MRRLFILIDTQFHFSSEDEFNAKLHQIWPWTKFQEHLKHIVEHLQINATSQNAKAPLPQKWERIVIPIWCVQKASGGGDGEFDDVDIQQLNWVEGNRKVF